MKLLILSDVHANIDSLLAIEKAEPNVDLTVFAGDFLDWGFNPHEVMEFFSRRPHLAVRGNHDDEVLKEYALPERQPKGKEDCYLPLNVNSITEDDAKQLASYPRELSFEADGVVYFMRHYCDDLFEDSETALMQGRCDALFEEIWDAYFPNKEKPKERRIILGHSHMCHIINLGKGRMMLNPGSTSYRTGPDSISPGADYIVVDNGVPYMRHVDYSMAHLRARLSASSFNHYDYHQAVMYTVSDIN